MSDTVVTMGQMGQPMQSSVNSLLLDACPRPKAFSWSTLTVKATPGLNSDFAALAWHSGTSRLLASGDDSLNGYAVKHFIDIWDFSGASPVVTGYIDHPASTDLSNPTRYAMGMCYDPDTDVIAVLNESIDWSTMYRTFYFSFFSGDGTYLDEQHIPDGEVDAFDLEQAPFLIRGQKNKMVFITYGYGGRIYIIDTRTRTYTKLYDGVAIIVGYACPRRAFLQVTSLTPLPGWGLKLYPLRSGTPRVVGSFTYPPDWPTYCDSTREVWVPTSSWNGGFRQNGVVVLDLFSGAVKQVFELVPWNDDGYTTSSASGYTPTVAFYNFKLDAVAYVGQYSTSGYGDFLGLYDVKTRTLKATYAPQTYGTVFGGILNYAVCDDATGDMYLVNSTWPNRKFYQVKVT